MAEVARHGEASAAVLDAMRRVPRAAFVPAGTPASETYDAERAVALSYGDAASPSRATSTVSAPRIVAVMLELLSLRPGLRVLEIGTGSGYNAALLAELVGGGGASLVTTIDIDAALVEAARARLSSLGWDGVAVVAGDGWAGVPERAPYDRIVATVGCADVAPAWIEQLAREPEGAFLLLPLHHGGVHPIMRVTVDAVSGAIEGRPVARSGFVPIQGHQASRAPWRHAGSPQATEVVRGARVERVRSCSGAAPPARRAVWDFSYWLAMVDDRTANLGTLVADDGSVAVIDLAGGLVSSSGPEAADLRDTLLARVADWTALGSPPAEAWHSTFVPLDATPAPSGGGQYVIRRVDYAQVVALEG